MVEVPLYWTAGIADDLPVLHPGEATDSLWRVHLSEQIEQQLFSVTATYEIDFGTLELDQSGVQGGEDPAKCELDR